MLTHSSTLLRANIPGRESSRHQNDLFKLCSTRRAANPSGHIGAHMDWKKLRSRTRHACLNPTPVNDMIAQANENAAIQGLPFARFTALPTIRFWKCSTISWIVETSLQIRSLDLHLEFALDRQSKEINLMSISALI